VDELLKTLQLLHKAVTVDGKTMFLHNTHLLLTNLLLTSAKTADGRLHTVQFL